MAARKEPGVDQLGALAGPRPDQLPPVDLRLFATNAQWDRLAQPASPDPMVFGSLDMK